jgi:phosphoribosyl-ATP pyrophosphohydrolase
MAVEPEDDELLLETPAEDEGEQPGTEEGEEQEQGSEEAGEQADDELEVSIGDGAAPASGERETPLAKHLREEIRRRDKELAELRRAQPQPQKIEIGPKPTLADCEYDEEKFEAEFNAWNARKAQAEKAETDSQQQDRAVAEAWQADVQRFESRKAELKVTGKEEAIETAIASLSNVQQAVIVKAADNPALVLVALGQHPGKLAEIAAITDPLKQAAAVAKLEGTLKVAPRTKAPDPEKIESGSARVSQGSDKTLERLEAKAARSGDRSEIVAYKAQLKSSARK